MKKNKDRKGDITLIKEIFNWNDYHPNTVKVKWNKMNWFYEVDIEPATPLKENHIEWFPQKVFIKLSQNELIVLALSLGRKFKKGIWSSSNDPKISDTIETLFLRIGRRDEFYQYRGYEY